MKKTIALAAVAALGAAMLGTAAPEKTVSLNAV